MVDFLKAVPSVSIDEYLWEMSLPQVRLASMDFTRTRKKKKGSEPTLGEKTYDNPMDLANDLGMPIF